MSCIVFENPGVIDPLSITTFGVSSKDNPSKSIGFFGTGLKYAIAVILRMRGSVTIYSGGERYDFLTKSHRIRHDEFDVVYMGGPNREPQPLGFTTELGKTWEMWQALRELYCNMLDESGTWRELDYFPVQSQEHSKTCVVVSGMQALATWADRDSFILNTQPLHTLDGIEVHAGETKNIFYQGIRCGESALTSLYTYNVTKKLQLTEDRTFRYSYEVWNTLEKALLDCPHAELIARCVSAEYPKYQESLLGFTGTPSPEFKSVVLSRVRAFKHVNESAKILCVSASFGSGGSQASADGNQVL